MDLQVALVYEEVQGEEGMEAWLDDVAIYHEEGAEDRVKDEEEDFRKFLARATAEGVPGRDRLRVHFWPPNEAKGIDARILVEQCHSVSEGIGTLLVFDLILASIADVLADSTPRNFEWGGRYVDSNRAYKTPLPTHLLLGRSPKPSANKWKKSTRIE